MKKIKNGMVYKNQRINLNINLITFQSLSKKEVKEILKLHMKKIDLFRKIKKTDNIEKLHKYSKKIDKLDIKAQSAWKFSKDFRLLTWWFNAPKCICSKHNNSIRKIELMVKQPVTSLKEIERFRVVNIHCPLHGLKNNLVS